MLGSTSSTLVYTALSALNELVGPPGANQQRQQLFADAGAVQMLCTCLKAQAEQGSIKTQQVRTVIATCYNQPLPAASCSIMHSVAYCTACMHSMHGEHAMQCTCNGAQPCFFGKVFA
jgi:hypothetical protein